MDFFFIFVTNDHKNKKKAIFCVSNDIIKENET